MTNYIENIEKSENAAVVFFNDAGIKAFSSTGYEITSRNGCANILFDHEEFGEVHIELAPGGSEDARILEYLLENPDSAIEDIQSRIELLEKEKTAA